MRFTKLSQNRVGGERQTKALKLYDLYLKSEREMGAEKRQIENTKGQKERVEEGNERREVRGFTYILILIKNI